MAPKSSASSAASSRRLFFFSKSRPPPHMISATADRCAALYQPDRQTKAALPRSSAIQRMFSGSR